MTIHNPQPETHQSLTPQQKALSDRLKIEYDFLERQIQLNLQTKGYLALLEPLVTRLCWNVSSIGGTVNVWVSPEESDHFTSLLDPRWVGGNSCHSYDGSIPAFLYVREGIRLTIYVTRASVVSL